jgi:DNA-binding IclR family transcriptional regulator
VYLHASAGGKSILAALPDEDVHDIVDYWGLPPVTDETLTSKSTLFEELEQIRERGYAINEGESRSNVYFIGKSVYRPDGTVHGGISVGGQTDRIRKDEFRIRITNLLDEYTEMLEHRIESTTFNRSHR